VTFIDSDKLGTGSDNKELANNVRSTMNEAEGIEVLGDPSDSQLFNGMDQPRIRHITG
jgi:hypothetical protein